MKIVQVALDVPLDRLFDYLCEDASEADIGCRTIVPFGPRRRAGIVVAVTNQPSVDIKRLKPVAQILRGEPPLSSDLLSLLQFCSEYYQHPLGETILNALPGALRKATPGPRQRSLAYTLTEVGRNLPQDALPSRAIVKRKLMHAFREQGVLDRALLTHISPSAGKALQEFLHLGWAEEIEPLDVRPAPTESTPPMRPALNQDQQLAVDQLIPLLGSGFQPVLLHGITGSGKTEVYLRTIEQLIDRGLGQALVLVPEINLTPQLEQRFRSRFPELCVVSLHSGMSDGERLENWRKAQTGQAQIVLGTRLAVFTPMPKLALIVVDEEHDNSFKQQDGLRYSGRDVAVVRAKRLNLPIILGSATPSLESYYNAVQGRYKLLTLHARASAEAALPRVRCVDTRKMELVEGLSPPLVEALRQRLERNEQSMIFINRRGYAPTLYCPDCGWHSNCSRCSSTLVVHLRERRLRCHHCGHEEMIPAGCPGCGNPDLRPLGRGTQRVEESLATLFPGARILRIDRDSTRRKHAWDTMLEQIHAREVDILVGTQMLAKGHDFPMLTLVGVVNVDGALYSTNFRASEQLFSLLMQVGGRAGRASIPGEVLVQTEFPDHPLFRALQDHDYIEFADALLDERRQAGFPPFVHQALLRAEASQLDNALRFLAQASRAAAKHPAEVTLYDPVPAQMARLAGKERAQLLVQSLSRPALQAFLSGWYRHLSATAERTVRWSIDVDPIEF
jgi:primosomal protein N' (replication factor Y)